MRQTLNLAKQGFGSVSPNPMVGCIIAQENNIISEGYHHAFGAEHAEVLALQNIPKTQSLESATLYVNLEPCAHHGKQPPCVSAILASGIKHVVIGTKDPNPLVSGKGIEALKNAGVKLELGVLEAECRDLNKRFFSLHEKKRPYIILKWAESADGFIGQANSMPIQISCPESKTLLHKWRSEEASIMVGTNTALNDNPKLDARLVSGKNPLRIFIDKNLKVPSSHHLLDNSQKTLIFNSIKNNQQDLISYQQIDFTKEILVQILEVLANKNLDSLIVEGGAVLLQSFIAAGLWDEARVFKCPLVKLSAGIKAPKFELKPYLEELVGVDKLYWYNNVTI